MVRKYNPHGDICQCDCKGGIADTTMVDVIVPANVSKWGAYGIEACLAGLLKEPGMMHGPNMEKRMIEASVSAGACDGSFGRLTLSVDGTQMAYHPSFVHIRSDCHQLVSGEKTGFLINGPGDGPPFKRR